MKLFLMFVTISLLARQTQPVPFANPSFEDTPGEAIIPSGWESLSPGSSPDVLPGAWGVNHPAQDGKTCLGLVVRDDGTREDIGQTLTSALEKGVCYRFTVQLAWSEKYVGHNNPCRLRIWGGTGRGKKEQLLTASALIDHGEWKTYTFQFVPSRNINNIILEAYYAPGVMVHYKGNILIDNCSPIERCDRA